MQGVSRSNLIFIFPSIYFNRKYIKTPQVQHHRKILQRNFLLSMFPLPPFSSGVFAFQAAHSKGKGDTAPLISWHVSSKTGPLYTAWNTCGGAQPSPEPKELLFQYFFCAILKNLLECKERMDSHSTLPVVKLLKAFLYELKPGLPICIIKDLHD